MNHHRSSSRRAGLVLALVAGVGLLSACGDDDPVLDPASTSPATNPPANGGAGPIAGPDATVPAEVPEDMRDEILPVEVDGSPLVGMPDGIDVDADPAIGSVVPVLIGYDYDGNVVRIDPEADGPTLVVFLAHWCPHCNNEVPRINELRDAGRFPADLRIVGVSTGVRPDAPNYPPSEWMKDIDWTYPVMGDGWIVLPDGNVTSVAASAYGVGGFPFVALVDGDGKVLARWSGEHSPDEFLQLITDHLPS